MLFLFELSCILHIGTVLLFKVMDFFFKRKEGFRKVLDPGTLLLAYEMQRNV